MSAAGETREAALVATVASVHAETERMATLARERLAKAAADVAQAQADHDRAAAAHVEAAEPSEDLRGRWADAEHRLRASIARHAAAKKRADNADEALAGAARALEQAKRDARVAELQRTASNETLLQAADVAWKRWLESRDFGALETLEAVVVASQAASCSLRELGDHLPDITGAVAVVPLLEHAVREGNGPGPHSGLEAQDVTYWRPPTTAFGFVLLAGNLRPWPASHLVPHGGIVATLRAFRQGARTTLEAHKHLCGEAPSPAQTLAAAGNASPPARSTAIHGTIVGKGGYRELETPPPSPPPKAS